MANGDLIKLGTFYLAGTKQARPTYPWQNGTTPTGAPAAGNITTFTAGQAIEIRDTDANDAYKIQWREVNDGSKKLYIADRVLLVSVSWDDLNALGLITGKTVTIDGQQYKLRVLSGGSNYRSGSDSYSGGTPTTNEWDRIITNESAFSGLPTPNATDLDTTQNETDRTGAHNQFWNWYYVYSWAQETYSGNSSYRAIRGSGSARYWSNYTSSYRYTYIGWRPVLEVLNSAPLISGSDSDLGEKSSPWGINYSVSDTDVSDTLTVVEKIDDTTINTINNAVSGQTYTIDLSTDWASLALGAHTVTITVDDGKGGTDTRSYTFTKVDDRIVFELKNPIETSIASNHIVVSGVVTVPTEATLTVKACNNGFDANPTWEDVTTEFNAKESHTFTNTAKTDEKWGINVRFELLKNTATDQCIIDGFGFSFD